MMLEMVQIINIILEIITTTKLIKIHINLRNNKTIIKMMIKL